ncbi:MAG: hypothetical protein ACRDV0_08370 [Acidimicrobiales bacterium]
MITSLQETKIRETLAPLVPADWFVGEPALVVDADEALIVGELASSAPGGDAAGFREATRDQRIAIAQTLEAALGVAVSWGVRTAGETTFFTGLGVPVMTRLRATEREVLDTLAAAGVARSRSDAVAWCVRFVAQHEAAWLKDLRASLERVSEVRSGGPVVS